MEEAKNPIKLPKGRETPYARYKSVEDFVDYVSGDDRDDYTHEELADLAYSLKRSRSDLRKELEGYGLKLAAREIPKKVRGFGSSDQDRWWGPGSGNESKMEESMLTAADHKALENVGASDDGKSWVCPPLVVDRTLTLGFG